MGDRITQGPWKFPRDLLRGLIEINAIWESDGSRWADVNEFWMVMVPGVSSAMDVSGNVNDIGRNRLFRPNVSFCSAARKSLEPL